jgi:FG-GAP repeat
VSAEGSTIAVGTKEEDSAATGLSADQTDNDGANSGAAYVFVKSAGQWSQQAFVKASNTESFDRFGDALAISGDGKTLAVGASAESSNSTGVNGPQDINGANDSGAVYVY